MNVAIVLWFLLPRVSYLNPPVCLDQLNPPWRTRKIERTLFVAFFTTYVAVDIRTTLKPR